MQVKIDITSEKLIKAALKRYRSSQQESPDVLLSNAIASMYSNADSSTVIRQAVTNSIRLGIDVMERDANARESEFAVIGQMSLLGDLIPEHKIPAKMQNNPAADVNAWMQERAQIERENLEEMRAAVDRQQQRTSQFAAWASATANVCETLERAGIDPARMSYAEAISKAEAIQSGRGAVSGEKAKRPLR